jgi:hypothetical protein
MPATTTAPKAATKPTAKPAKKPKANPRAALRVVDGMICDDLPVLYIGDMRHAWWKAGTRPFSATPSFWLGLLSAVWFCGPGGGRNG